MTSPFPGMDPYLEAKAIWPGFHHVFTDEIMAQLNTKLSPKYYADVEVRTVLEEVGVAAAPIKRLAVLPEQFKLRTVQVTVTETQQLVTSLEIGSVPRLP